MIRHRSLRLPTLVMILLAGLTASIASAQVSPITDLQEIGVLGAVGATAGTELSADCTLLYATQRGPANDGTMGSLAIYDVATGLEIGSLELWMFSGPGFVIGVEEVPDRNLLYVAVSAGGGAISTPGPSRIDVVDVSDPTNPTYVKSCTTQQPGDNTFGATFLRVHADGSRVFITDRVNQLVEIHDIDTCTSILRIPVGNRPIGIDMTPDGSRVFVAVNSPRRAVAIDTEPPYDDRFIALPGPTADSYVAVHPNGERVYVGNRASSTIDVIDALTEMPIGMVATGAGGGIFGMNFNPAGCFLFASSTAEPSIRIIDTDPLSATFETERHSVAISGGVGGALTVPGTADVQAYGGHGGGISVIGCPGGCLGAPAGPAPPQSAASAASSNSKGFCPAP